MSDKFAKEVKDFIACYKLPFTVVHTRARTLREVFIKTRPFDSKTVICVPGIDVKCVLDWRNSAAQSPVLSTGFVVDYVVRIMWVRLGVLRMTGSVST